MHLVRKSTQNQPRNRSLKGALIRLSGLSSSYSGIALGGSLLSRGPALTIVSKSSGSKMEVSKDAFHRWLSHSAQADGHLVCAPMVAPLLGPTLVARNTLSLLSNSD